MKITGLLTMLLLAAQLAFAGFGEINGRVVDQDGESIPFAHVTVEIDSQPVYQVLTDVDGYYVIKPIETGTYDVRVTFVGTSPQLIKDISISDGQIRVLNFTLAPAMLDVPVTEIIAYKDLVEPGFPITVSIVTAKEIEASAAAPLDYAAVSSSKIYQEDYGSPIQFRGSRPDATLYFVDGVKIIGEPVIVRNSVEDFLIFSGGIPAKYGDATGGIIVITTKNYKLR